MVKVILGSFGAFPIFNNLVSRKWLVVEQSRVEFEPRGEYSVYTGYFWQLSACGHSRVSRFISDCRQPYALYIENVWNGVKFGPQGWVFSVHKVLLTVKCLRSFWGHWVFSPIFNKLVSRKQLAIERNGLTIGHPRWVFSVCRILMKLNASSDYGVIWRISDFQQPCISKNIRS